MSELEAHKHWISTKLRHKHPALVAPCKAALKSFDHIEAMGKLEESKFNRIVFAAGSDVVWLSQVGTTLLGKLAIKYKEARKIIQDFSISEQTSVRFNALMCVHRKLPKRFVLPLLAKGLVDKSARIRRFAASKAQELNLVKLIPKLEEQDAIEKNKKTKAEIEFYLALLRDGYFLQPLENGDSFDLIAPRNSGFAVHRVSKTEIDQKGIQKLILELKHD